ncbi:MAG: antibiotic biosynthesis monooxygenase [Verrucomicrobiae bacterium]|nr:antibiotic biosynthesis monooxygenase [Verrucomicrobiae bacterium]NNJ43839.1 hypothetical protein [Akkermansiaceae bacterium]
MIHQDTCCTIVPYFNVQDGQLDVFKDLCTRLISQTQEEPGCLYYGFSFDGNTVHCREGYVNADALLAHVQAVGLMIEEALKISEIARLEVHGPATELAKLKEPLAELNPHYFTLECGFRK